MSLSKPVLKVDEEKRLVYGEVYAPGVEDTDGDFMTAEEIEKMAHRFLQKFAQGKVDTMHDREETGSVIVESFIARDGDPDFITGAWVVAVKVNSDDLWHSIVKGELNGFSMDALAKVHEVEVEVEIPAAVDGDTQEREGHVHKFHVKFGPDGSFLGGRTNTVDGHYHEITRSTITGETNGHTHRFSYAEALVP